MKSLRTFLSVLFAVILGVTASAQTHDHSSISTTSLKTETFKVSGKCDMCKTRIEKTVLAEGVTTASWDVKTRLLTVTFDPAKTGREALSKKLASVGHDTDGFKAPDEVYNKLPGCCHYERK